MVLSSSFLLIRKMFLEVNDNYMEKSELAQFGKNSAQNTALTNYMAQYIYIPGLLLRYEVCS